MIYGPAPLGLTAFPPGINSTFTITSSPTPGPYAIWLQRYPALTGQTLRARRILMGTAFPIWWNRPST